MKVFISWSADRSQRVARALYDWLPNVLQIVKPWISTVDIPRGSRWAEELGKRLKEGGMGILCLTPENRYSPWVMFEAGALWRVREEDLLTRDQSVRARRDTHAGRAAPLVCPYLLDLTPEELGAPLNQFNAAQATKEGTLLLVETMNVALGEAALPSSRLLTAFERFWPDLEERLVAIPPPTEHRSTSPRPTGEHQLLENILTRLERIEAHVTGNGAGGNSGERAQRTE